MGLLEELAEFKEIIKERGLAEVLVQQHLDTYTTNHSSLKI